MLKVGLTGGIACGKSFVGEALAACGCLLIQADEIGHAVMAPGGEAFQPVVQEFGREILAADGAIDRRALAARVPGLTAVAQVAAGGFAPLPGQAPPAPPPASTWMWGTPDSFMSLLRAARSASLWALAADCAPRTWDSS